MMKIALRTLGFTLVKVGNFQFDGSQERMDPSRTEIAANEDQPCALIIRRPSVAPLQWMEHVLNAMHHSGLVGLLGDCDQSFQAEKVAPAMIGQGFQKQRQGHG